MRVKKLTVGPILGHSDTNSIKVFGRAKFRKQGKKPRRAHGAIRVRQLGSSSFSMPVYFKMNPNFDMSGVAIINDLTSDTEYEYQVGWFFSEVESEKLEVSSVLNWNDLNVYTFKTASSNNEKERTLVVGSCRYALRLFGGTWFDDRGDKTFRSILNEIDGGKDIHQLIMCGDQIYADDLNVLGADKSLDEYNKRYRKAFTTKNFRKLMARVPTYMTLDDHEIEDNWPSSASQKDWVTKFPAAIHAYSTYQASHSPLFGSNNGRLEGTPTHLWYKYRDGCCDIFVTDTRTERSLDEGLREIIGPRQMSELLSWLGDGSGRVKIIVSSVPLYESESIDKWHGFTEQRDQLLEFIRVNAIQKVVFLSGDVHACMSSELSLDQTTKVVSVVSSAFFWPYPHPKRRSFKLSGQIRSNSAGPFEIKNASNVHPTDAYVKLEVTTSGMEVTIMSRKGALLDTKNHTF